MFWRCLLTVGQTRSRVSILTPCLCRFFFSLSLEVVEVLHHAGMWWARAAADRPAPSWECFLSHHPSGNVRALWRRSGPRAAGPAHLGFRPDKPGQKGPSQRHFPLCFGIFLFLFLWSLLRESHQLRSWKNSLKIHIFVLTKGCVSQPLRWSSRNERRKSEKRTFSAIHHKPTR